MSKEDKPVDSGRRAYLEIEIDGENMGRIILKLFDKDCPLTVNNFIKLCTGELGLSKQTGKKLHYKGSIFHRVIKGFCMQGGDFTKANGTGGISVYGRPFRDENFKHPHDKKGLLSMANSGPNSNGSQFFITFSETPWLNGKHVVFGEVVEGYSICDKIEKLKTNAADRPNSKVQIVKCGVVKPFIEGKFIHNNKIVIFEGVPESEESKYVSEESEEESEEEPKKKTPKKVEKKKTPSKKEKEKKEKKHKKEKKMKTEKKDKKEKKERKMKIEKMEKKKEVKKTEKKDNKEKKKLEKKKEEKPKTGKGGTNKKKDKITKVEKVKKSKDIKKTIPKKATPKKKMTGKKSAKIEKRITRSISKK
jgi:peptidyl-prolyl isomerase G (cyclophilin G)